MNEMAAKKLAKHRQCAGCGYYSCRCVKTESAALPAAGSSSGPAQAGMLLPPRYDGVGRQVPVPIVFAQQAAQREIRVVDKRTGGEKGSKLARFSLIPGEFVWALAEHFGIGARKYADRSWERGYAWSLTLDALERHLNKLKMGQWLDLHEPGCAPGCTDHTETPHIIAVAWHACALFIFKVRGLGTNDIHPGLSEVPKGIEAAPSRDMEYRRGC